MPFGDTPPGARAGYQGPIGTPVVGPYAGDKGLSFGADNTFNVREGQEVRVLDGSGNVIYSGFDVDGANRAVAVAQSLSDDLGKNANFKIQTSERTINTDGSVGPNRYIDVAYAAPRQTGLGFLADNVLPFAASFIPGIGPIAGAALGSAVSSGLQGRSLQDALVRAAIAGGSAYAGGQVFGPATPGATPVPGGNIASVATPAIPAGAFDGILVNATRAVAPSLAGSAVGGALGSGLSGVTGSNPPSQNLAQQTPTDLYAGVEPIDVLARRFASGSGAPFGAAFPIPVNALLSGGLNASQPTPAEQPTTATPEEIVVTATPPSYLSPESLAAIMATFGGGILPPAQSFPQQSTPRQQPDTVQAVEEEPGTIVTGMESYNPTELLAILGGAGALAAATAGGGVGAGSNVVNGVDQANGDIVVRGSVPGAAPIPAVIAGLGGIPAITQGALSPAQTAGTPPGNGGVLGTGLTLSQLLSIGSIGGGLLQDLLAGGGTGTGTGTPYVSPFGTGAGFAPRQDMRANPNILDYERYGFGPEAMFFRPEYSGLLPANAPAQAPPAMTINPAYMPLI